MSDYSFGINFLKQWFNSSFRGVLTFQGVLGFFTQNQIESIGRFARILPSGKWQNVFNLSNKDYKGTSIPSRAAFASYFMQVGNDIDWSKIAGDVALDTVQFVGSISKFGLIAAGSVIAIGLLVYATGKSGILNARKT